MGASYTWPHVYTVTIGTNTVTAATGDPFVPQWHNSFPWTVTISSVVYNITTMASDGTSMTIDGSPPQGSSFSMTAKQYTANCTTACQNVVQAVIRAQKRYGLIFADVPSVWAGNGDMGYSNFAVAEGLRNLTGDPNSTGFWGLRAGNIGLDTAGRFYDNYEVVDDSVLQTNQTHSGTDQFWGEAKIDNTYVTPDGAAVLRVTDSASPTPATADFSVALQGVAIGVEHPNEIVMAGASPFTLHPWVTGSSNSGFTCSLSPSGTGYGTITSGCVYSPPSAGSVSTTAITQTTVTVTSTADGTITKAVLLPNRSGRSYKRQTVHFHRQGSSPRKRPVLSGHEQPAYQMVERRTGRTRRLFAP